jgi:ATP-binding cassette subfamily C protein
VYIVSGSILQNVALGFSGDEVDENAVWKALGLAKLDEFVKNLPDGIHMQVGERGVGLSGGQRQRLGIARALYTDPQLLVLDEATSALDGQTEMALSNSINELKGGVTVILIAHRLSTVRDADQVLYLSNGLEAACGTFEQVRSAVPDFDIQAKLLGL